MKTTEERKISMYIKAREISEKRSNRVIHFSMLNLAVLSTMLILFIAHLDNEVFNPGEIQFRGSFILSGSSGGYVLVAVISFIIATVLTYYFMKKKKIK